MRFKCLVCWKTRLNTKSKCFIFEINTTIQFRVIYTNRIVVRKIFFYNRIPCSIKFIKNGITQRITQFSFERFKEVMTIPYITNGVQFSQVFHTIGSSLVLCLLTYDFKIIRQSHTALLISKGIHTNIVI